MAPNLSIILSREPAHYKPGETIHGTASWRGADNPKHAAIRLFWTTSGRGTSDVEVVGELVIPSPDSSGVKEFSFQLPDAPPSFSGKLITLRWGVELVMHPGGHGAHAYLTVGREGKELLLPVVESKLKKHWLKFNQES